jgi:transposase-like protein
VAKSRSIWHNRAKYSLTFSSMNKSYTKHCKKCKSSHIKKDWFKRWKQRYKCKDCRYVFQNRARINLWNIGAQHKQLWDDYSIHKQTYAELSEKYGISTKTVQKRLDAYEITPPILTPANIILLIDTTYFWDIGVMAFKDSNTGQIIHSLLVRNESMGDYKRWVKKLQDDGWHIDAIVCDGKKGLLGWFTKIGEDWKEAAIPTQMCQFHQVAIIRRYITKKPKIPPNKDLKELSYLLTRTDRETFEYYLEQYEKLYGDFLKEKTIYFDPRTRKEKWYYTHKKTRSAFFSLKRNLPYLFVSYNHFHTLKIPNTTNWLEWYFSHLKSKVRIHRWLKRERKIKLILSLLSH